MTNRPSNIGAAKAEVPITDSAGGRLPAKERRDLPPATGGPVDVRCGALSRDRRDEILGQSSGAGSCALRDRVGIWADLCQQSTESRPGWPSGTIPAQMGGDGQSLHHRPARIAFPHGAARRRADLRVRPRGRVLAGPGRHDDGDRPRRVRRQPGAHNPNGEDSRGLWQINLDAHADADWAQGLDLYNPRDNAIAAWHVSAEGRRHRAVDGDPRANDGGARYLEYADEARAAAAAYGETGRRQLRRPARTTIPDVPAGDAGRRPVRPTPLPDARRRRPDGPAARTADRRRLGAAVPRGRPRPAGRPLRVRRPGRHDDPIPDAFDCSELVEWAAAQAGVDDVAEASYLQYLALKEAGTLISVEEAINTPGALLFRFPSRADPGRARQDGSHVAISLGDGRTIEAMSPTAGIGCNTPEGRPLQLRRA